MSVMSSSYGDLPHFLFRCSCFLPQNITSMEEIGRTSLSQQSSTSSQTADGYQWMKYSHKVIEGGRLRRNYYRCSQMQKTGCQARKTVDRDTSTKQGEKVPIVTLSGEHNHPPASSTSLWQRRPSSSQAMHQEEHQHLAVDEGVARDMHRRAGLAHASTPQIGSDQGPKHVLEQPKTRIGQARQLQHNTQGLQRAIYGHQVLVAMPMSMQQQEQQQQQQQQQGHNQQQAYQLQHRMHSLSQESPHPFRGKHQGETTKALEQAVFQHPQTLPAASGNLALSMCVPIRENIGPSEAPEILPLGTPGEQELCLQGLLQDKPWHAPVLGADRPSAMTTGVGTSDSARPGPRVVPRQQAWIMEHQVQGMLIPQPLALDSQGQGDNPTQSHADTVNLAALKGAFVPGLPHAGSQSIPPEVADSRATYALEIKDAAAPHGHLAGLALENQREQPLVWNVQSPSMSMCSSSSSLCQGLSAFPSGSAVIPAFLSGLPVQKVDIPAGMVSNLASGEGSQDHHTNPMLPDSLMHDRLPGSCSHDQGVPTGSQLQGPCNLLVDYKGVMTQDNTYYGIQPSESTESIYSLASELTSNHGKIEAATRKHLDETHHCSDQASPEPPHLDQPAQKVAHALLLKCPFGRSMTFQQPSDVYGYLHSADFESASVPSPERESCGSEEAEFFEDLVEYLRTV